MPIPQAFRAVPSTPHQHRYRVLAFDGTRPHWRAPGNARPSPRGLCRACAQYRPPSPPGFHALRRDPRPGRLRAPPPSTRSPVHFEPGTPKNRFDLPNRRPVSRLFPKSKSPCTEMREELWLQIGNCRRAANKRSGWRSSCSAAPPAQLKYQLRRFANTRWLVPMRQLAPAVSRSAMVDMILCAKGTRPQALTQGVPSVNLSAPRISRERSARLICQRPSDPRRSMFAASCLLAVTPAPQPR